MQRSENGRKNGATRSTNRRPLTCPARLLILLRLVCAPFIVLPTSINSSLCQLCHRVNTGTRSAPPIRFSAPRCGGCVTQDTGHTPRHISLSRFLWPGMCRLGPSGTRSAPPAPVVYSASCLAPTNNAQLRRICSSHLLYSQDFSRACPAPRNPRGGACTGRTSLCPCPRHCSTLAGSCTRRTSLT